jgi:hypothetical protein
MKAITTFLLMACCVFKAAGQVQLKKLLERNVPCNFEGTEVKLDTAHYAETRNVSYSYSYTYPKYFKEIWPVEEVVSEVRKKTDAYIDTVTYLSPDKHVSIKIFAGQVVPFPLGSKYGIKATHVLAVEKAVDDYIRTLKAGRDKELGKLKVEFLCKGIKGYNYSICLKGSRGQMQYLYKIIVAEMPVSGDLIFSHWMYQYPLTAKDKYEALGVTLANAFKAD